VYGRATAPSSRNSLTLLVDTMTSFAAHCVEGIEVDTLRTTELRNRSLMLLPALAPHMSYDRVAQMAKHAHSNGCGL
jgi:fumarate hydratase class II